MRHSKDRVEAFSDAVFAFAATLIVVSFEVPDTYSALQDLMQGFISFGLSFLALVLIWKIHYNFFRRIDKIDNVIISINMVLLFVILFYVYPMKFMANMFIGRSNIDSLDHLANLFSIYSLGFILIFIGVATLYRYASTQSDIKEQAITLKYFAHHFSFFAIIGVVSIILAQLKIGLQYGVPGFVYVLLGPICYWYGKKYGPDDLY